jgi:potassium efflux system protein
LFRIEEEVNDAPPLEREVQQFLAALVKRTSDSDFTELQTRVRSLLKLKRSVRTELLADERIATNQFTEARQAAQELLTTVRTLESFVMRHVLWARSVSGPVLPSPAGCVQAVRWSFSYEEWSRIASRLASAGFICLFWFAGFAAIVALFRFRGQLAKALQTDKYLTGSASRARDLISRIVLAFVWTSPGPALIAYAGWVVGQAAADSELARAVAGGTAHAAAFLLSVLLIRRMLRDDGAADILGGWPQSARETLSNAFRRLAFVFTPLWFVSSALAETGISFYSDPALQVYNNSLGRLCFLVAVVSFLIIGLSVLRPTRAVAHALGGGYDAHGFSRVGVARWTLIVVFCAAFLLALAGFYITAFVWVQNILRTAAWTIALLLVQFSLRAWRLSQRTRAEASQSSQTELHVDQADAQVRRLTRFGLILLWMAGGFFIWSIALPSLSLLKQVQLLPTFSVGLKKSTETPNVPDTPQRAPSAEAPNIDKQDAVQTPAAPSPLRAPAPATSTPSNLIGAVYLSDVLIALLVGVLISMLVGTIPGLLHFTVFRRIKLDVGGQYAVATVTRYIVIAIGVVAISAILGLNWSKVQWLAAALTFGIGFGLQEIFANFAAGMILLFDRSIRVGDVVTVGNWSGIVARIQMRATTVTLGDQSEMVVPNREFVTSKLVNWTRSNPDTRVDVKVGVDYGSDIDKVREVLLRVAQTHSAVLKHPPPQVLLTEFGASAVLFELRVFSMYAYGRAVLLDELHRAVVTEFRAENIVMAYPQLDVHVHSASAAAGKS